MKVNCNEEYESSCPQCLKRMRPCAKHDPNRPKSPQQRKVEELAEKQRLLGLLALDEEQFEALQGLSNEALGVLCRLLDNRENRGYSQGLHDGRIEAEDRLADQ